MSKALTPRHVDIECYFEGIKVPIQSIQLAEQLGSPATAQIAMPAHSGALRLLAGTTVHIFGRVEQAAKVATTDNYPGTDDKSIVRHKVLLFEGEITGQSYTKDPSNRAVSISAQSLIHKWTQVYMHSADMMSDRMMFAAIYVYQDWASLPQDTPPVDLDAEGNPVENETPIQPKNNKYMRFEYQNEFKNLDGLEFFITQGLTGEGADKEAHARGDYMPFFQDLIEHLEYLNLYYGLFAKTYRITDTVFTFPNVTIKDAINLLATNAMMFQTPTGMADQIALLDIIYQILSLMNYTMIMPAAPTYCVHPYQEQETAPHNGLSDFNEVPMRAFMLPDTKFSVPASCNVLFPDEVERFNFSRNMAGEPTRLFMGLSPTDIKVNSTNLNSIVGQYIVPGLPFFKSKEQRDEDPYGSPYTLGFTPEETHRGVVPLRTNFQGLEQAFLNSIYKAPGDNPAEEGDIAETMAPETAMGALAYNTAHLTYFSARYGSRQCSFSTAWNPHRVVGLPGLYFDMDGSPSIMGILTRVVTNIDSQGSATQSITFDLARILYDMEGLDRIQDIVPSMVDGKDLQSKKLEQVDKEVLAYAASDADKIPWLPAWYDKIWYGHDHIGRDVYSLIVAGTRAMYTVPQDANDTVTKMDSAWTYKEAQPAPAFPEDVRDRYNDNSGHYGTKVDYSIFEFCRTAGNGWFRTPSGIDAGLAVASTDTEEQFAAKRIALAVRDLKRAYQTAQIGGREKSFILKTTSRHLTPKLAYWSFLGVKAAQQGTMTEDDDLTTELLYSNSWQSLYAGTILEGDNKWMVEGITPTRCREILSKFFNDEITWAQAMDQYMLHPFCEKRRAHVLAMSTLVGLKDPQITR